MPRATRTSQGVRAGYFPVSGDQRCRLRITELELRTDARTQLVFGKSEVARIARQPERRLGFGSTYDHGNRRVDREPFRRQRSIGNVSTVDDWAIVVPCLSFVTVD